MLKKDVLKILKPDEAATAIERDQSRISRMPSKVPEQFRQPLLKAAKRKVRLMLNALARMGGE